MDKSNIKNKLSKLADENKIQGLFLDEESLVSVILDLDTIEYKGVYLKFRYDDAIVEINTAISSLKINNDGEICRESLDDLLKAHIDMVAVDKFNINKLDEDYFKDLEESLEDEIAHLNDKKSKKIFENVRSSLEEIHQADYSYENINDILKRFEITEKSNHYIVEKQIGTTKIKYNTGKGKITIKNLYDYKKKFSPDEYVADFNEAKFIEAIQEINRKRRYNKARMEMEDGVDEPYPSYSSSSGLAYSGLDIDND